MEKRARAVGAHRELVVDDANHEELCARCYLLPCPLPLPLLRPCCIDCAHLAKSMLDCFGEALRDRVRVVQARLLARYPKAYRASRRDKTLPRDGTREPFDRQKLRNGIEHAATGRLDEHSLDGLASEIEEQLRTEGGEVGSDRIGVTVLERLRGGVTPRARSSMATSDASPGAAAA